MPLLPGPTIIGPATGMVLLPPGEQVLGAAASTVTWTNIPASYRLLRLLFDKANSDQGGAQTIYMRFNSDSGASSYANNQQGFRSEIPFASLPGTGMPSGYTATGYVDIPYYNIATAFVMAQPMTISRTNNVGNAADMTVIQYATYWQGGGGVPVNRIDVFTLTGSINAGARFALYGMG